MQNLRKSSKHIKLIIVTAAIAALIVVLILIKALDGGQSMRITPALAEGVPAPDFTVELLSGESFTLSDYGGYTVFINFWAAWCLPCVSEMPDIEQLYEKYKDDSVIVIGINCGENKEKVQNFIDERGFTYNIGLDEDNNISGNLYSTQSIPYTLIVNPDGIISKIIIGSGNNMFERFDKEIAAAR